MSSCTGHCCERFFLGEAQLDLLTHPNPESPGQDWETILDMVIWLEWTTNDDGEFTGGRFTCKHFDVETRRCKIYEDRPRMCRNYPYGERCTFPGCTMAEEEQLATEPRKVKAEEVAA